MGRTISCKVGNEYRFVWKYHSGVQPSEMHRIHTELGVGEYHVVRYVDVDNEDIKKYLLKSLLGEFKHAICLKESLTKALLLNHGSNIKRLFECKLWRSELLVIEVEPKHYIYFDQDSVHGDDILILYQSDIEQLQQAISQVRETEDSASKNYFILMTKAIANFMLSHHKQEQFVFEGEFI